MTTAQAEQKMIAKLELLTVDQVKEIAVKLNENDDEAAIMPLEVTLEYLEGLMSEAEYVEFCETL